MSTSATVPIVGPDGKAYDIPFERMHDALQNGGKMGVYMKDPQGQQWVIPADKTQDAVKAGGTIVPYNMDESHQKPGVWETLKSDLSGIPQALSTAAGALSGDPRAASQMVAPVAQTLDQDPARKAAGYSPTYRALAPVAAAAGTNVNGMEQSAKEGDVGGVVGHAAAPLAMLGASEAIGHGAPALAEAAPALADAGAAAVRGTAKGVNTALAAAPRVIGASAGSAIGAATHLPHAATVGFGLGAMAGEKLLPKLQIPGEQFGLSKPVFPDTPLGPPTPAPEVLQANALAKGGSAPAPDPSAALASIPVRPLAELPPQAVHQAVGELGPSATISALTDRANKIAQLGELLNKGLGGKALEPNIPLRNQGGVVTPNESLPQGHIPVDSSALKSYKYDPSTHEFESVTTSGSHYIHGDVSPDQAAAFEAADSKGKAWNDLRKNSTLVAKVVNGKRIPVKPAISEANEIGQDEWDAGHAIGAGVEGSSK